MQWQSIVWHWLIYAAAISTLFFGFVWLLFRWRQQPAERLQIMQWTLLAVVLVPCISLIPGIPHVSLGWRNAEIAPVVMQSPTMTPPISITSEPLQQPNINNSVADDRPIANRVDRAPSTSALPTPISVEPLRSTSERWISLIVWSYSLGVLAMSAWHLIGLISLFRLNATAKPAPDQVHAAFHDLVPRLRLGTHCPRGSASKIANRVRLRISDQISLPLAYGLLRPVILLPQSLCTPTKSTELHYALLHEWSHIERGDLWRWRLATLVGILSFYQPLYWWIRRQLRLCQDYLADSRAAVEAKHPADYAEFLVSLARLRVGLPTAVALSIGDRKSNLFRRVAMLLDHRQILKTRLSRKSKLGIACAAILAMAIASGLRLEADDTPPPTPATANTKPSDDANTATSLTYEGKVQEENTGEPIAGARVSMLRYIRRGDGSVIDLPDPTLVSSTDADGNYRFTILPEQAAEKNITFQLSVDHPDYPAQSIDGSLRELIRIDQQPGGRRFFKTVQMRPGKQATGRVQLPDGKPAADLKILAYSRALENDEWALAHGISPAGSFYTTRTDEQGRFRVLLVTPGEAIFWILPKRDYALSRHVLLDKRDDLGTFRLAPGHSIHGTVVDCEGKPMAGIYIHAERTTPSEPLFNHPVGSGIERGATSDGNGQFEMSPLPPGEYCVRISDYLEEPSLDRLEQPKKQTPPAIFLPQKLVLESEREPAKIELRAVPEVTIEAQIVNSKGEPRSGYAPQVYGTLVKSRDYYAKGKIDANGKITIKLPRGLNDVRVQLLADEQGSLRWRMKKDQPLNNLREIRLGTVTQDMKGIEIVRYVAPIVLVKVVDKHGDQRSDVSVDAHYLEGKQPGQIENFQPQVGGRYPWRSEQLLPDEQITIVAHAAGCPDASEKVTLPEGEKKELTITLEKAIEPVKKPAADKPDAKTDPAGGDGPPEKPKAEPAKPKDTNEIKSPTSDEIKKSALEIDNAIQSLEKSVVETREPAAGTYKWTDLGEVGAIEALTKSVRNAEVQLEMLKANAQRRIAAKKQVEAIDAAYVADTVTLDLLLDAQRRCVDAEEAWAQSLYDAGASHGSESDAKQNQRALALLKVRAINEGQQQTLKTWRKILASDKLDEKDAAAAREQYLYFRDRILQALASPEDEGRAAAPTPNK